jgi:hypothetical protein
MYFGRMIKELERVLAAYFKVVSRLLNGGTEEDT